MANLREASLRHARHYESVLGAANETFAKGGRALEEALEHFDLEWPNINLGQVRSAQGLRDLDYEFGELCNLYPIDGSYPLDLRQHPRERILWLEDGLKSAEEVGNRGDQAKHLNWLGTAYRHMGEIHRSIECHEQALLRLNETNDPESEGDILSNLGQAYEDLGDAQRAINFYEKALGIVAGLQNRWSECGVLGKLGQAYYLLGEIDQAKRFHERSFEAARESGNRLCERVALINLGKVYALLGNTREAIKCYDQALTIARMLRDRRGEGISIGYLGRAYYLLGEIQRSIEHYQHALTIAREVADRSAEAELLKNLSVSYMETGDSYTAQKLAEAQNIISREIGNYHRMDLENILRRWSLRNVEIAGGRRSSAGTITWLHLSDLHFRESQAYDENIVLQPLLRDLTDLRQSEKLHPDFIVVTGDLSYSGKAAEYAMARDFFDELLKVTELSPRELFLIPGNHDVNKDLISTGARKLGSSLMDRDTANAHLTSPDDRRLLFSRFKGYAEFLNDYFAGHLLFDDNNYFYVKSVDVAGRRVALLGLNSVWVSHPDDDRAQTLVIGEKQTRDAIKAAESIEAEIKIALLHHPFEWLREFDQRYSADLLRAKCDFALHGHMHRADITQHINPDGNTLVIAGGACYDTRDTPGYPNSYNLVRLDLTSHTGIIYLRNYTDESGGFWIPYIGRYRNTPNGKWEFKLP